jgi:hypothetical protein
MTLNTIDSLTERLMYLGMPLEEIFKCVDLWSDAQKKGHNCILIIVKTNNGTSISLGKYLSSVNICNLLPSQ